MMLHLTGTEWTDAKLREWFDAIDVNHDGVISIGELLAGLTKQGYTDEEIHVLFGRIDTNLFWVASKKFY